MRESQTKRLARAVERATEKFPFVDLELDLTSYVTVISGLQLTLRHPDLPPYSRRSLRLMVDAMIAHIGQVDAELAELLRLGDDPDADVMIARTDQ